MADWTAISNANVEPDAPFISATAFALRDNPIAIAEGATGAPRVQWGALASNLEDYILASSGLSAHGPIDFSGDGRLWTSDSNRDVWVEAPNDAGASFSNATGRTITVALRIHVNENADDSTEVRILRNGSVVSTSSFGGDTVVQFNVSCAPGDHMFHFEARLGSGSGLDFIYLRGVSAYIDKF